jgi:F0F1-type ATP synthase assembly protein I
MPFRIGEERAKTMKNMGILSTVGFSLVIAIVIGVVVGYYLDEWLGTSPWLFLVFFFVGLAAGLRNMYLAVRKTR